MPTLQASRNVVINVRMKAQTRDLIDLAARTSGKNRSEFLLEAATRAAQEALLDQRFFALSAEQWKRFAAALDGKPKVNPRLKRLLAAPVPWES